MHKLNNPEAVGRSFYSKPNNAASTTIDYLYNSLYGQIPTRLDFSDKYDSACLNMLNDNFDHFTCVLTKVDKEFVEEGVWFGKENTPYEKSIVGVYFKSSDGIGLRNGFGASDIDKDFVKNMYVTVKAVTKDREQALALSALFDKYVFQQVSKIHVLVNTYGDLALSALPMEAVIPDMQLNYGVNFEETNTQIVASLNDTQSGLYLFHGAPGTGKSTMARTIVDALGMKSFRIRVEDISHIDSSAIFEAINIFEPDAVILDDFDRSDMQAKLLETLEFFQRHVKLVIATVNNRSRLDDAILRPGRFDELLQIKQMDDDVVKAVLGEDHADAYDVVKEWPIAFIQEYVKRLRFMTPDEAELSVKELAQRVKKLSKYDDEDEDTSSIDKVLEQRSGAHSEVDFITKTFLKKARKRKN